MAYSPTLSYAISNKNSGKALSVERGGAANGSHVILFEYVSAEESRRLATCRGGGGTVVRRTRLGGTLNFYYG